MSDPATPARANLPEFSVSEIAGALKRVVEDTFPFVRVRGEISNLKFHSSGHVYFDLKDEKATLNAVIWRGTAQKLKIRPEQGLEVVCTGRISTYPGSSRYQIIVEQVELAGLGALMAMLEERKKRLAAEGLFAAERKKPLPYLPSVIGVITSPTGAVIRDIMHRLNDRFPRRVLLWAVPVQGERAAAEVAAAIAGFNALKAGGPLPIPDVLIVARGGGSIEDLMAFNEELVVRAPGRRIPVPPRLGHAARLGRRPRRRDQLRWPVQEASPKYSARPPVEAFSAGMKVACTSSQLALTIVSWRRHRLVEMVAAAASVLMVQAFNQSAFPVDTHIHRLAMRWKLSRGPSVVHVERDLKKLYPPETWHDLHLRIIYYGREHCTARGCDGHTCEICRTLNG